MKLETTVMAVVAHELGHVLQREYGYLGKVSVLALENNADFLSGYYLGTRKRPFVNANRARFRFV
jgi:hypothetical protein